MDNLDFPQIAKNDFGIDAVEYVNQFFKDKAKDETYLDRLKKRCDDHGVKSVLIMCDGEGDLGDPDDAKRTQGRREPLQVGRGRQVPRLPLDPRQRPLRRARTTSSMKLAADGLRRLSEFGAKHDINVIVENHGGLSSNGEWLAGVMKTVDLPNCGTLPDFGNFQSATTKYDRYKGVDGADAVRQGRQRQEPRLRRRGQRDRDRLPQDDEDRPRRRLPRLRRHRIRRREARASPRAIKLTKAAPRTGPGRTVRSGLDRPAPSECQPH